MMPTSTMQILYDMPLSSPTSYVPNAYSKRPYYLLCMSSQSSQCLSLNLNQIRRRTDAPQQHQRIPALYRCPNLFAVIKNPASLDMEYP